MKSGGWIVIIIGLFLVGIAWWVMGYNKAVTLHENTQATWAQVENQLQRRNDLVPNLVNTVKGFAQQEREVFTEVTRLRSQWQSAETRDAKIDNAAAMSGALGRLMLVAERYPQLKSDQNFLALQSQLEGTENRIAVERRRYNESVRIFNTFQRKYFGKMFAEKAGVTEPAKYFEVEEKAKAVPVVSFE